VSTSTLLLLAGGLISATGAVLLGLYGGGLISSIEVLTWRQGQSTSPTLEQALPALAGGSLYIVGLFIAQIGVWLVATSAIVSVPARAAFILVGVSMVAGGALIVRSIGGAFAALQIAATSDMPLDIFQLREGIAENMEVISTGSWLLLPAPLILIAATLLGTDPARKPGEMAALPIVPPLGTGLAALVGIGASVWSWIAWNAFHQAMAGPIIRPNEMVESVDSMLAANFILGAVIVLAAMPAAMSALGMSSDEAAPATEAPSLQDAETLLETPEAKPKPE